MKALTKALKTLDITNDYIRVSESSLQTVTFFIGDEYEIEVELNVTAYSVSVSTDRGEMDDCIIEEEITDIYRVLDSEGDDLTLDSKTEEFVKWKLSSKIV